MDKKPMTNAFIISIIVIYAMSAVASIMMLLHSADEIYFMMLFWVTILTILLLLVADHNYLKEKMPAPKLFSIAWIIIPPIYLFMRARYLQQKHYYLMIYVGIFVLEYAVMAYLEKQMMSYY